MPISGFAHIVNTLAPLSFALTCSLGAVRSQVGDAIRPQKTHLKGNVNPNCE